jgi:hypothetical protein
MEDVMLGDADSYVFHPRLRDLYDFYELNRNYMLKFLIYYVFI